MTEEASTQDLIRESFDRARAQNKTHLLVLAKNAGVITFDMFVLHHTVTNENEILPLLREANKLARYGITADLVTVFDLARDFEEQAARDGKVQISTVLSHETRTELAAYDKERDLARRQDAWDEQPVLKRWFGASRPL